MINPKQIVVHSVKRIMSDYNDASFNMVKNDLRNKLENFCQNKVQGLTKTTIIKHAVGDNNEKTHGRDSN